jgi:methyltransferase
VNVPIIDNGTAATRLAFSIMLLAMVLYRVLLMRSSDANAQRLLEQGEIEVDRRRTRWIPAFYAGWVVSALVEVWWLGSRLDPTIALVGSALTCLAIVLRVRSRQVQGAAWTWRRFEGQTRLTSRFGPVDDLADGMELAGIPLLHGAAITGVTAWVMMSGFKKGLSSS